MSRRPGYREIWVVYRDRGRLDVLLDSATLWIVRTIARLAGIRL